MSKNADVPLLIHGRALWTPATKLPHSTPLIKLPLVGWVQWQELFLTSSSSRRDVADSHSHCPVVEGAMWRGRW